MQRDGPWLVHAGDGYRLSVLVGRDALNGNVDFEVVVESDGSRWGGTMFTLDNVAMLLERKDEPGDDARYLWADGMVVVPSLTPSVLVAVVEHLVRSGDYRSALTLLED